MLLYGDALGEEGRGDGKALALEAGARKEAPDFDAFLKHIQACSVHSLLLLLEYFVIFNVELIARFHNI